MTPAAAECRPGCAACCIAISISSPVPGFPQGKPAGVRCSALGPDGRCRIWGLPEYPDVCRNFRAGPEHCGATAEDALRLLAELEAATTV